MVRPYRSLLVIGAACLFAGFGSAWTRASADFSTSLSAGVRTSSTKALHQVLADDQQPERLIMITGHRGYLLTTSDKLWWTHDAGQQWSRVRAVPTALNLTVSGDQIEVQTADRLWTHPLAGAHWTAHPMPTPAVNPAQIDFVNEHDGWLITTQGMAAGAESVHIWWTRDDGNRWTRVSSRGLPYQGSQSFAFANLQDGWMFGENALRLGVPQFFHTRSGGTHWAPVAVSIPKAFQHHVLAFTGMSVSQSLSADGVMMNASPLPTRSQATQSWVIYHHTTSQGWNHGPIQTAPVTNNPPTILWTGSTAWVVNGSQLWCGNDWGHDWKLLHQWSNPIWADPIQAFTWTETNVDEGFVIVNDQLILISRHHRHLRYFTAYSNTSVSTN